MPCALGVGYTWNVVDGMSGRETEMSNTTYCAAGPACDGDAGSAASSTSARSTGRACTLSVLIAIMVLVVSVPVPGHAAPASPAPEAPASDVWQSWGGQAAWHLNTDMLAAMGLRVERVSDASVDALPDPGHAYRVLHFSALTTGALTFQARGQRLHALVDGALHYKGGFILTWPGGRADLRGYALRPHVGKTAEPFMMDLVDSHGRVLLLIDHAHAALTQGQTRLSMRDMNVRVSPQLAQRIGRPQWAMRTIGRMSVTARVTVRAASANATAAICSGPWPTEAAANQITNIRLYQKYSDSVQAMRCHLPNSGQPELGAQCPGTSTDGLVVIAPDSSLENVGDTAVPWYRKFNANRFNEDGQAQPPYNNDQHPFLVWNLYRMDADGGMAQIGQSGVKHAFWAANNFCQCTTTNYHVIFPQCRDTYSVSNNDDSLQLAPRSELIPAQGIWGRCGSVYDRDCDGQWDHDANDKPVPGAANDFDLRLVASEGDLLPALNPGARYFFEYWYLVRDDEDIHDTMGYREVTPYKYTGTGGLGDWNFSPQGLQLGPAINAWVDPQLPGANQASHGLSTDEGEIRVAVRVDPLPDGRWRYRYAVMNLDFARAMIDPAHASEPNLKILSNAGFDGIDIPLPADVAASDLQFGDADRDAANAWTGTMGSGTASWRAPADNGISSNTLDWGTLYSFSFVASTAPGPADLVLQVATSKSGMPTSYTVPGLSPRSDLIFSHSFEI